MYPHELHPRGRCCGRCQRAGVGIFRRENWAFPGIFRMWGSLGWVAWLSLAPQVCRTMLQPSLPTPLIRGLFCEPQPCATSTSSPSAQKKGRKGCFVAGVAVSWSCPRRAGFPSRGELWALPWPRGAAGALSHPAAPCSTLRHPAPVRACAAVPGCAEPIFGDQSGRAAAWEGRHVPSRGGHLRPQGQPAAKAVCRERLGKRLQAAQVQLAPRWRSQDLFSYQWKGDSGRTTV